MDDSKVISWILGVISLVFIGGYAWFQKWNLQRTQSEINGLHKDVVGLREEVNKIKTDFVHKSELDKIENTLQRMDDKMEQMLVAIIKLQSQNDQN